MNIDRLNEQLDLLERCLLDQLEILGRLRVVALRTPPVSAQTLIDAYAGYREAVAVKDSELSEDAYQAKYGLDEDGDCRICGPMCICGPA